MNFKTTYTLFGILVGILGLFLLAQLFGKKRGDDIDYALPSLHATEKAVRSEDISTVEIQLNRPQESTWVFYRTEHGWQSKEPAVRLDGNAVDRIISQVIDARTEENADVRPNKEQFGLAPPAAVVTVVKKGDEGRWTLEVGNVSFGGDEALVYASSSDRLGDVFAVRRSGLDSLLKSSHDKKTDSESPFKALPICATRTCSSAARSTSWNSSSTTRRKRARS